MPTCLAAFERTDGRAPADFEFYVPWNAPLQINPPHPAVAERTRRFMNLVIDANSEPERGRKARAPRVERQPVRYEKRNHISDLLDRD